MPAPVPISAFARFAQLLAALERPGDETQSLAALKGYFAAVAASHPADAAWALHLLVGGRPPRRLSAARLREVAPAVAGLDEWLFASSLQASGDLAETLALVLPPGAASTDEPGAPGTLAGWLEQGSATLAAASAETLVNQLRQTLAPLDTDARILLLKLLTGAWRAATAKPLVQRALAAYAGLPTPWIAERVAVGQGRGPPSASAFAALLSASTPPPLGQPLSWHATQELQGGPESLGELRHWQAEWQHDGERVQVLRRGGQVWLWTAGDELVTERHKALAAWAALLPEGCVLDGVATDGVVADFVTLDRQALRAGFLAAPVFVAFDAMEVAGTDLRCMPLAHRRARLEALLARAASAVAQQVAVLSPLLQADSAATLGALRQQARSHGARGLVFKSLAGRYGHDSGSTASAASAANTWWRWPAEPLRLRAVLLYAQPAAAQANTLAATEYTFAVWSESTANEQAVLTVIDAITRRQAPRPGQLCLLPVARLVLPASHRLAPTLAHCVRQSTVQSFGPVRSLRPTLVAELAFDGVVRSPRHKSGVSLRRPQLLSLRTDLGLREAANLATVHAAAQGALRPA